MTTSNNYQLLTDEQVKEVAKRMTDMSIVITKKVIIKDNKQGK